MTMAMRPILIACEEATQLTGLGEALSARSFSTRTTDYAEAAAALEAEHCSQLVVVPALATIDATDTWTCVAEELTRNFELIQRFVRRMIARNSAGHVIVLLPAAAAMGDPSDGGASALAGGMLSLVRTLALELKKFGMTANAVLFERAGGAMGHTVEVAALVETLAAQRGGAISGQAIYACSASDAGRLHP